jgi:hypothetical protein
VHRDGYILVFVWFERCKITSVLTEQAEQPNRILLKHYILPVGSYNPSQIDLLVK